MKRILLPLLILSVFAASMSAQRGNNIDARKLQLGPVCHLQPICRLYKRNEVGGGRHRRHAGKAGPSLYLYGPGRDERDDGTVAR